MTVVLSASEINRIEIYSWWAGFGDPTCRAAKLTITNAGGRFVRQEALESSSDELPHPAISRFLEALARPAIPQLDPALFDLPAGVIDRHYGSIWTDDYPSHLIRVLCDAGRQITIVADAQYAFMLPLKITDSATDTPYETYDPELSRALAELMPEGHLDRDRLAGKHFLLELDRTEIERNEQEISVAVEPNAAFSEPDDDGPEPAASIEAFDAAILRILSGEESADDAQDAERSGQLSERLLKRNSLETARDLLARGADPSIADDVGQTALMHAAFPPFDRERFRLLVAAGADVDARRQDGLTGLHLACSGGEAEAAAEWVRAEADIEARSPGGGSPLMLGATWPRIVRTLLDAGADINAVDDDGHGALVYVILLRRGYNAKGELEALQTLIDGGADVNLRDRQGVSPLGHAKKMVARVLLDEEVIQAFRPCFATTRGAMPDELKSAEAIVTLLIAAGARESDVLYQLRYL